VKKKQQNVAYIVLYRSRMLHATCHCMTPGPLSGCGATKRMDHEINGDSVQHSLFTPWSHH